MQILSIATGDPGAEPPTPEEYAKVEQLMDELREKGVLIAIGSYTPDLMQLRIVRSNGKTTVTDGPFTESKEVMGGFALMNVKDRDDAVALAKRFLALTRNDCTSHVYEVNVQVGGSA